MSNMMSNVRSGMPHVVHRFMRLPAFLQKKQKEQKELPYN